MDNSLIGKVLFLNDRGEIQDQMGFYPEKKDLELLLDLISQQIEKYDDDSIRQHNQQLLNRYFPPKLERDIDSRRSNRRPKISVAKRKRTFEKCDGKCTYCGCELDMKTFHVDHMVPVSRGGSNKDENLTAACPTCNTQKNNKTVEEFEKWRKNREN